MFALSPHRVGARGPVLRPPHPCSVAKNLGGPPVLPLLCRAYDRPLLSLLSWFVKPPRQGFSEPNDLPASPDDLPDTPPIALDLVPEKGDRWRFDVESPV